MTGNGSRSLSLVVIAEWERLKRFAKGQGLVLLLDTKRDMFILREDDKVGRVVASNLTSLEAVKRILRMYHRLAMRYGDVREPAHAAAEVHP